MDVFILYQEFQSGGCWRVAAVFRTERGAVKRAEKMAAATFSRESDVLVSSEWTQEEQPQRFHVEKWLVRP